METVKAKFKCSYDALFEGCDVLAISMAEEMAALAAKKPKYTAAFIAAFKAKITAARAIEDEEQRASNHSLLRNQLVKHTDGEIQDAMGDLRLYIRDAYSDKVERGIKLSQAGFDDYEAAMNYNWEVLQTMMGKANKFIIDNDGDLSANNNMPATFPVAFADLKTQVDAKVPEFLNERENAPQGTQDKLEASNELYEDAIMICEDGQHVFRKNPAKQKQFVWDDILEVVTPTGKAGLKFDVKEEGLNSPIEGAIATIQQEGEEPLTTTTDALGRGAFTNLKDGKYIGTLTHPLYVTVTLEIEISIGVTSFKHYKMVKI